MNKKLKKELKKLDKELYTSVRDFATKKQIKAMKKQLKGTLSKNKKEKLKKFAYTLNTKLGNLFLEFLMSEKEKEKEFKREQKREEEEERYSSCGSYSSCR